MIRSFRCRDTETLAAGERVRPFSGIAAVARRKLRQLQIADRLGQYSIRINDQWRLCFRWTTAGAEDVEIVDYH